MELFIIRHAWAEARDPDRWPDDGERPLLPEGRNRFSEVVNKLRKRGMSPEVVASSPLVRCRQTAEIVSEICVGEPPVVELDALAPGSDLDELMHWTEQQSRDCSQVAWVGHAPDVGRLTAEVVGDEMGQIRFAKGAVALVRFDGLPEPGEGELRWLATAKVLGC